MTVLSNGDDALGSLLVDCKTNFVIDPVSNQADKGSIFLWLTLVTGISELEGPIMRQIFMNIADIFLVIRCVL